MYLHFQYHLTIELVFKVTNILKNIDQYTILLITEMCITQLTNFF